MQKHEFETLSVKVVEPPMLSAIELKDRTPRTLVYGYTCDRDTFHVYLDEDGIHKVVYRVSGVLLSHTHEAEGLLLTECVPDKRLYPETCDYEFCSQLKRHGVALPFTNWHERNVPLQFWGLLCEELTLPRPLEA